MCRARRRGACGTLAWKPLPPIPLKAIAISTSTPALCTPTFRREVGKIEVCPAFDYSNALWKAKFQGVSYGGYGYNWLLGAGIGGVAQNVAQLRSTSSIVLFADCGQVNTFEAPASASNPMMEEFYILDSTDKTYHFRHNNHANILFVDGHVEVWAPYKGTEDRRIKDELFGRITPVGSSALLK